MGEAFGVFQKRRVAAAKERDALVRNLARGFGAQRKNAAFFAAGERCAKWFARVIELRLRDDA